MALRDFAQVNVSHDGVAGGCAACARFAGGVDGRLAPSVLFAEAGVAVGVNHVLTRQNRRRPRGHRAPRAPRSTREMQLLWFNAGGARNVARVPRWLTRRAGGATLERRRCAVAEHEGVVGAGGLARWCRCCRIAARRRAALARFRVFGCEQGGTSRRCGARRCGISRVQLRRGRERAGGDGRRGLKGRALAALRRYARRRRRTLRVVAGCGRCAEGGCRIVSEHLTGAWAPDPVPAGDRRARAG